MATHYDSLDGLRGVAAYTVVISHFANSVGVVWAGSGAGQIGVMLFFALSGFLMGKLYLDRPITDVADFYLRRVARVFPLFLVLVAASYLWGGFPLYRITDANLMHHLLFLRGTSLLWTVAVEVQFYAAFPLLWFLYRLAGREALVAALVALSLLAFALGFPRTHTLFPHLPYFLAGIGLSLLPLVRTGFLFPVIFALYFVLMPGVIGLVGDPWLSPAYILLIPVLLYAAMTSSWGRFLGHPALRLLGNISYSVYLLHLPILQVLRETSLVGTWALLPVFLAATTAVAWISYRFFETPTRVWITKASALWSRRQTITPTANT